MPLFYWNVDTSQFIFQPQTTRWRSRFRGPRESWKQNLEMDQIAYDIYQLYNRTWKDQIVFENYQYDIEFGSIKNTGVGYPYDTTLDIFDSSVAPYDSLSGALAFTITGVTTFDEGIYDTGLGYDAATPNTEAASIYGTQDLIRRIQNLRFRVNMLERNGWNISAS